MQQAGEVVIYEKRRQHQASLGTMGRPRPPEIVRAMHSKLHYCHAPKDVGSQQLGLVGRKVDDMIEHAIETVGYPPPVSVATSRFDLGV